ncbi:MAG: hypothetical protein HYZ44_15645 [Bacteroidetes bacterium]|nr:hypothetical protein [Bacteroidota bacterium]
MKLFIGLLIFSVVLLSVSWKTPPPSKECFPDKLFATFHLNEAISLDVIKYDRSNYYFMEKRLVELDSQQKEKLIKPFLKTLPVYSYQAHFISKLSPVDNLQPIILRVVGTDYHTLWLLLINKNCTPISFFYLEGENCEGPMETDSTVTFCPVRRSICKGNTIVTYETRTSEAVSDKKSMVDSLVFTTTFNKRGEFVTKRKDSTRYYRQK